MTDILEILSRHSSDNPIPMPTLARQLGTSTRGVQAMIEALRRNGKPIAERCDKPNGYWLAQTPEEALAVAEHHRSRGIKILEVAAAIERAAKEQMRTKHPLPFEGRNVA